nr:GIY-YIG nuclease family protein [Sphingobacterium faecale]
MIYTVYVLHSPVYDKIYIGYTGNLANRLLSHSCQQKAGRFGTGPGICSIRRNTPVKKRR